MLIGNSEGRKDEQTNRLTGRARDNRLVHIDWESAAIPPRPGDLVSVTVTQAKPYFLIADPGDQPEVVRTRAGDAFEAAQAASCDVPTSPTQNKGAINLSVSVKSSS